MTAPPPPAGRNPAQSPETRSSCACPPAVRFLKPTNEPPVQSTLRPAPRAIPARAAWGQLPTGDCPRGPAFLPTLGCVLTLYSAPSKYSLNHGQSTRPAKNLGWIKLRVLTLDPG